MANGRFGSSSRQRLDAPSFSSMGPQTGITQGNMIWFISPQRHRKISLQGLRSHRYNFSDTFISDTTDFLDQSLRGGSNKGLKELLTSEEAQASITPNSDIDAVVDLNGLRDYWKFIMVLNKFNNKRTSGLGTSHTVVITGRCADYEEPLVKRGSQIHYNPNCELIIEGKSVFQSYERNAHASMGKQYKTKSSMGYGYEGLYKDVSDEDMFENTPGGMNFNTSLDNNTGSLLISEEPCSMVGVHGPTHFDRKQHMPGMALRNTMTAINKTFRERERRTISPITDMESSLPDMVVRDPTAHYPNLVQNLKEEEHRSSVWSMDQFGPSVNDRVVATSLESEYGIQDPVVLNSDSCEFWAGEDQTVNSQRALFETMLEKVIPTLMIEYQIHAIDFEIAYFNDTMVGPNVEDEVTSIAPTMHGPTTEDMNMRWNALKSSLIDGLLGQILEMGGDFILNVSINLTSTSSLALNFLDEGQPDGHVREFFPSEFALTTPMIGNMDTVRDNQTAMSGFLDRVCRTQTDQYMPDDINDSMSLGTRDRSVAGPRRASRRGQGNRTLIKPKAPQRATQRVPRPHVPLDGEFSM